MKRTEFLKQLKDDRMLAAYLFLGEEPLFHQEMLQAALDHLLTRDEQQFNFLRLNAGALGPEELLNNLETPPFFGTRRVIYLSGLENAAGGVEETVLKGFSRLADGVYLLISASKLDGRKKIHQELQKHLTIVDCSKVTQQELPVWLKQRAEPMGLQLSPNQQRVITQRLGTDLVRIRTELEKIRTFVGKETRLTDAELDVLVPGEPEPDIFGLIDAVAQRNPKLGLPRLEELLNSGESELKILATLARQFRNIAAALEARRQGWAPKILAEFLGINPFVAEKSFIQSGQFSLAELQQVLERLVWADYRMKTGQREPRLELELAIAEICSRN